MKLGFLTAISPDLSLEEAVAFCVEVEDRAYEESLDRRKEALTQSPRFLTKHA
jgi:hypothetical protein